MHGSLAFDPKRTSAHVKARLSAELPIGRALNLGQQLARLSFGLAGEVRQRVSKLVTPKITSVAPYQKNFTLIADELGRQLAVHNFPRAVTGG